MSPQKLNNAGKPLPDIGLKWGRTPKSQQQETGTGTDTTTMTNDEDDNSLSNSEMKNSTSSNPPISPPSTESPYTAAEEAKLRSKGINPALKAEMDASKNKSREKGFWGKVGQTAMGGGWIK